MSDFALRTRITTNINHKSTLEINEIIYEEMLVIQNKQESRQVNAQRIDIKNSTFKNCKLVVNNEATVSKHMIKNVTEDDVSKIIDRTVDYLATETTEVEREKYFGWNRDNKAAEAYATANLSIPIVGQIGGAFHAMAGALSPPIRTTITNDIKSEVKNVMKNKITREKINTLVSNQSSDQDIYVDRVTMNPCKFAEDLIEIAKKHSLTDLEREAKAQLAKCADVPCSFKNEAYLLMISMQITNIVLDTLLEEGYASIETDTTIEQENKSNTASKNLHLMVIGAALALLFLIMIMLLVRT